SGSPVAAFEDRERRLYGVQWHPEVKHSAHGQTVLEHFLYEGAGLAPDWTPGNVIADQVAAIRAQVGDARVICALSGGVDSAVAAALVQRAVGDQLTCVHVDHGLMRAGEVEQIERDFVAAPGAAGASPSWRRRTGGARWATSSRACTWTTASCARARSSRSSATSSRRRASSS